MRSPLAALPLAALLALGACDSNPAGEGRASPLPYGYREPQGKIDRSASQQGAALDEISAVVWGEVLTRRRLIRETGGRVEGQDDAAFERELASRQLEWARTQLMVKAAEQEGLRIVPAVLDDALARERERLTLELSKNTGRPVTFEEYLAQQRLSEEEFRTRVQQREMRMAYLRKLLVGFGKQVRPQVDLTVSPAEVRRLYRERPELFDTKPAARFALFQLQTVDAMVGDVTPVQAEQVTAQRAEELARLFASGVASAELAQRFKLGERQWKEFDQLSERFSFEAGSTWLFAPERRVRDAKVFEFEETPGGPVVLGVLELRVGAKRTFQESYDDVVRAYEVGRQGRLEAIKVIELVQGGTVVWPASLADQLVDAARGTLDKLDRDEVLSRARFR